MITVVGTVHVFNLKNKVKGIIESKRPQAVCIELDDKRLYRLENTNFLSISSGLLSFIQQVIALRYGTRAGNDMMGAVEAARKIGVTLFIIDKDIDWTRVKVSQALRHEFLNPIEVVRKLFMLLESPLWWKDELPELLESGDWIEYFVLDFEDNPDKYKKRIESFYPYIKKIIFDEREQHMDGRIREISLEYKDLVAVVGAGHLAGLRKLLSDLEVSFVKLKEILNNET